DGVTTSLQLSRNSRPPMLDHQDKYMMKAQVHVSKSSAISDIQALPRRKHYCQSIKCDGNDKVITRIIQETLHVNFLENKPNVAGTGPAWLFDIDSLTRTMNYQPVHEGNQTNSGAGFLDNFGAEKAGEEVDHSYMLFLVWYTGSTNPQNNAEDAAFDGKKHDFDVKKHESKVILSSSSKFQDCSENSSNEVTTASSIVPTVRQNSLNSTKTFSAAGPSITAVSPTYEKTFDIDASQLQADFNNLESSIPVSPIPTTRIHKDYPVSQIIDDLSSTPQTRSMTRAVKDQGGLSQMFGNDFYTCMFACFLLKEEPKRKVWVLVDLPYGKREIGTKWVYRNKKDERGIVIRNKARLIAQGHTQEEGINYEEVFSLVARIEAIRLFLAYASFMGFMMYQMDVKNAFLYGTIKEEVAWYETLATYLLENDFQRDTIDQTLFIKKQKGDILLVQIYVDDIIFGATNKYLCRSFKKMMKDKFQMSSMGELTFFLGLQVKQKKDGKFISQDKYVAEILRKFRLTKGKIASTPIDTEKPLLKDPDGEDVDVNTYSDPKSFTSPCSKEDLWISKRQATFRLVCKKQTVVATSSTEAEYVAAASYCAQMLWIQNQLLDYGAVSIKLDITSNSSDSPLVGVNTPRSDEDRLEIMELTVFWLPKIE
nr:retrovirus-related Pol polyprotein from transposon TNT 1-94 [Tanacetum cinerariifolium]